VNKLIGHSKTDDVRSHGCELPLYSPIILGGAFLLKFIQRSYGEILARSGISAYQSLTAACPSICPRIIGAILAIAILAAPALAQTYTYDAGSRLIQVAYSDGTTLAYTYDADGNQLSLSTGGGAFNVLGTPAITNALTVAGTFGTAFNFSITATNSPTTFSATGLPPGLVLNGITGLISGSPSAGGTFTVTISATNPFGTSSTTLVLVVIPGALTPTVTNLAIPVATFGSPFSYSITATNTPTTFSATGLPPGLVLNGSTGLISGSPSASGTFSVTVFATNSSGTGATTFTLTVNQAPPAITSAPTAAATFGTAFSYSITAANLPATYSATGLPSGLFVNVVTGLISGVPNAAGTFTVAISATNSFGTGSATLLLTVNEQGAPVITSAPAASATIGTAFSYSITATSTGLAVTYKATGLPAGLVVNPATGLISGIPMAAGFFNVTIYATNSAGVTGSSTLTLTVDPASPTLTATAGNGQVVLSWSGAAGAELYIVSQKAGSTSIPITQTTTAASYLVTGLTNGSTYSYFVQAISPGTILGTSNVVSVTPEQSSSGQQTFFGSFGGSQGASSDADLHTADATAQGGGIAAVINADGTSGTLIGYISSLNAGFAVNFTLGASGTFTAVTTALTGGTAAGQTLTFNGQLASGVLSGSIQELGLPFSATVDPPGGSSAAIAGLYQASTVGSSNGVTYSILGTQGEVFALSVTSGVVAAGTGSVAASGAFTVPTAAGAIISGTVSPTTTTVAGTIALPAGGTVSFTGLSSATTATNRLVNLSVRGQVTGPNILIEGFVIAGSTPKTLLLRAVGPGLTSFGLTGVLTNPDLQLFDSNANVLLANSGWGGGGTLAADFAQAGAFPLANSSTDAAAVISLQPGAYTTQTSNAGTGGGGVALEEIYDLDTSQQSQYPRLVNMSGRGQVGTGSDVLIGGFVIDGNSPETVLIRGLGPGLGQFGVTGTLAAPLLSIYDSNGNVLAKNQSWGTPLTVSQGQTAANAPTIAAAAASVGAFSLAAGSSDSALIVNLAPGAYTAQISGVNGAVGSAMIEIYELPPSQ
jgi:YD repeat-containing protein